MALPIYKSDDQNFMMMQNRWASDLNPLLRNQLNQVSILRNVSLVAGDNVINHLQSKTLTGWFIVDIDAATTIYRSAPLNNLTLTLNSSAPATVSLGVF